MKNITIILIEPENPGNTGAILRAMKNFDFENLLLVGPKFDLKSEELRNRAKWANDLIPKVKIQKYNKNIIKQLHKKFDYLVATTAKIGRDYNILRSPVTPSQLAEKISELEISKKNKNFKTTQTANKQAKVGILIGREGQGLNNEEIEQADFSVTIPASKKYGTMNISHATTIILYEIFKKNSEESIISHIHPITDMEKKQIEKMLNQILDKMHFTTKERKETQKLLWKKIVGRSFLSRREAYALMGFLKKVK